MDTKLFQAALDEAIKFGPAARLILTFPGNADEVPVHPLAYEKVGDGGFRVEVRVSTFDDDAVVDDVIFLDAASVETVELLVKEKGAVWQDEPYVGMNGEEP